VKKGIIALICMVITLVFIIVALVGTWYGMSTKLEGVGTMDFENDVSATLTSITGPDPETGEEVTKSNADWRKQYEASGEDTGIFDVLDNTFYITIFTLIIAILAVIGILGLTFNFGNPKTMKMIGGIFGIITLVLAFVAVFYFMTVLPAEAELQTLENKDAGFWYSESKTEMGAKMSASYGPGYAWYLMLIGAILALIAAVMIFIDKGSSVAPVPPPQ